MDTSAGPLVWPLVLAVVGLAVGGLAVASRRRRWVMSPIALAVLVAAVLGLAGAPPRAQLAVAVVGAAVGLVVVWRWQRLTEEGDALPPGAGAMRLVDMVGTLETAIPATSRPADEQLPDEQPADEQPGAGSRATGRPDGDALGTSESALGRVRVGGETWRAQARDGIHLASGQQVVVTEVRGTRLVVAPVPATYGGGTDVSTDQTRWEP